MRRAARSRFAEAVRRQGVVRGTALWVRWTVFRPGGRLDGFYQSWIRPAGRRLPRWGRRGRLLGLTVWRAPEAGPVASILVLKLDHIGDFLLAAPSFGMLRRSFPRARITLLCGAWNAALAERSGYFDHVATFARFAPRAEDAAPAVDVAALRALGTFDLAIDLRLDEDTRSLLTHVSAQATAGYRTPDGPALTIGVEPPALMHQREAMLAIVAAVVGAFDPAGDARAAVEAGAADEDQITGGWARPVIALSTGSGRAIKNWPLERFIALAAQLRGATGGTLVLLGGPDQMADAAAMRAALGEERLVDLVGALPLGATFGVLRSADLFIGNDSALGHASAALGRPTLVVFPGIDPLPSWAPLGPRAVAVKATVSCSPCHLSDLNLCPNGHLCMTGIPLDRVAAEAARLLKAD